MLVLGPLWTFGGGYGMRHQFTREEASASRLPSFASALFLVAAISTANADDRSTCLSNTTDDSVSSCTRLIEADKFRGHDLASVYVWRSSHLRNRREFDRALGDANEAIRL